MFNPEKLQSLCRSKGLTLKEVIEECGYSEGGYYTAIQKGSFRLDFVENLAKKLNTTVDYFLQEGSELPSTLEELQQRVIDLQQEVINLNRELRSKGK